MAKTTNTKVYLKAKTEDLLIVEKLKYMEAREKWFPFSDSYDRGDHFKTYFFDEVDLWVAVTKLGEARRHE